MIESVVVELRFNVERGAPPIVVSAARSDT